MTNLYVRFMQWLDDEDAQINFGGGSGLVWLIVGILAIIALVVWLWINIDVSESAALQ